MKGYQTNRWRPAMKISARCIGSACLLLLLAASVQAHDAERWWLVRDGQACATIVRGQEDVFAATRLGRFLAEKSGTDVEIVVAGSDPLPAAGCLILLGSSHSNRWIRQLGAELGLALDAAELTNQGYVARRVHHQGRDLVILAGGGREGAIYAVADLINWHLDQADRSISLGPLDTRQVPRFRYRWFWNWDHRMDWGGPGRVGTVMGGGGTFSKRPEAFLIDFKRCIDYMADHKFNGLIIWGFLRDTHGGVEASRALCHYARHRGIRILPGVGTSGYAGYYFEGNHPYNAQTWLAEHPELCSVDRDGTPRLDPCPSQKANQDWIDRGAQWLFENFAIGGVNLEMGDFLVCYCDGCKQARAAIPSAEPDYYKDMAISHRVTLQTMRRLAPDAWLSYATYTGYQAEMMDNPPQFLALIPGDALCQWTLTGMAADWPTGVRPMAQHNIGYLHWCNRATQTDEDFYLDQVRAICCAAAAAGFEGLDTYGELSSEWPNVEISYLAWEAFLWQPDMTVDELVDQRLARLYGGPEAARSLLDIIGLVCTKSDRAAAGRCAQARQLAAAARRVAAPTGHPRWDRLIDYLDRHQRGTANKD